MQGVSESLAGRVGVIELQTLALAELESWSGREASGSLLLEWIWCGGYPELHAAGLRPDRFYGDYVATYLERDVRQIINVRNLRDFDRFMRLLAVRTGQLLSLNAIATDIGISPNTAKDWLSALVASNVVYLLEPYYRNLGKRLVKTPKLYFMDTGLCAYLAGFRSADDLRQSQLLGAFFETAVFGQLWRRHANRGLRLDAYFYRDHAGHEVDFVIPMGEKLRLIECKWSESPSATQPGLEEVTRVAGKAAVLSRTVISSRRGRRSLANGVMVDDCVVFATVPL
jgi:predicted AAA+ superfamily ATPase